MAELGRNTVLLGRTAINHAAYDPLLLVLQTARRLPQRLRRPVARALGAGAGGHPTLRSALAAFVADRPDAAASLLAGAATPRSALGRRVAAELAIQLGQAESVPGGLPAGPTVTRARAAWQRGEVSGAIDLLDGVGAAKRYRARLVSERATMQPGFRLDPPVRTSARPMAQVTSPRALHVLTNSLPRTRSGYAIRSHEVLRAQQQAGIAVEAVTRIGYPVTVGLVHARGADVVDGITYRRLLPAGLADTPGSRLQQMADGVLRLADRFEPTVLHTTTNFTNALVTEAVARATGLPWVYEVRGVLENTWLASRPEAGRAAATASERYQLLRAKETELMLGADHVVTLSETLRAELVGRGVPSDRITVVPNAVDERLLEFRLEAHEARARLGLPSEGFWVGTVSSLVPYEGLTTLLDAVALLRARGLDARAALVGDGVSRPTLIAHAERLGIEASVLFPGRVAHDRAALWHRALDVFVVPRLDVEVCRVVTPLKPVEAMAAGRPVVASNLPALAEVVATPGTGMVVPPQDVAALAGVLAELATDSDRRSRYGGAGRSFAATRTWQANGTVYRFVYERLEAAA
ncbi:glycosyltransferase family 4 protein [Georgenia sp. AZ-5]|uniref:glycosyltransferase family 4 protein n=1 Tax=Georgenia sp. AZ-5 TaxID=3367526 RepID=UPI003753FFBE